MKRLLYELSESWKIAAAQMRSNLTRSTLTALGVIIGIIAVTLMGTAVNGRGGGAVVVCAMAECISGKQNRSMPANMMRRFMAR